MRCYAFYLVVLLLCIFVQKPASNIICKTKVTRKDKKAVQCIGFDTFVGKSALKYTIFIGKSALK